MFSRVAALIVLTACSSTPVGQNDASTDASAEASNDVAQEAAIVPCSTPGAKCPSGGSCFFAVGDCSATTGICYDSFCISAPTETVCHCDGSETAVPQCGPGNYALAQASYYGPCVNDAGTD